MTTSCQNCGLPATRIFDRWTLCEKCALRYQEQDRWWADYQAGRTPFNTSLYDPFYRGWLLSSELFDTVTEHAPTKCRKIDHFLGGDLLEFGRDTGCWVQIWLAPNMVLVAYPTVGERNGFDWPEESIHEFNEWTWHLRNSEPQLLGHVRGRCSYGAYSVPGHTLPIVKWAQYGDWAALARTWFVGDRTLAPWP